MLHRLKFLSAGESHGPELTMLLDGLPAGLPIDRDQLNEQLARRQRGFGAGGRMGIEKDRAQITAGVTAGRTTGGPVSIRVTNRDFANWKQRDIVPMSTPRPGHSDLVGAIKFGHRDLRPSLERASARETTMRVCAGGLCRQFLATLGIEVGGYAVRVGTQTVHTPLSHDDDVYRARFQAALDNDLSCPEQNAYETWHAEIKAAMQAKDTLGGVLEIFALGLPVGLGSFTQWDRRLDTQLGAALLSIQAMKGVEIGDAFAQASQRGTEVHDEIFIQEERGELVRHSNRAGGLEGGVTTGAPLVARVAMKPISTTLNPLRSVNLKDGKAATTVYERSDFCALPRAVPIAEAMMSLVLADALLVKIGGDRFDQIQTRYAGLKKAVLSDIDLDDTPWRFNYLMDDDTSP